MKIFLNLFSSFAWLMALNANALITPTNSPPVQIVMCREDANLDAVIAEFKLSPTLLYRALNGFAAPMDAATIQQLKTDDRILAVEADGAVSLCGQTNSTGILRMAVDQFPVAHVNGINEPLDVDVAIIDTGIDPHEDLNIFSSICIFSDQVNDEVGHGTAVAGVVGALDNGLGVVGVAPGVRLWSIKTYGPPPENSWANFLSGLDFVLQNSNQVSVANMSLVNAAGNSAPIAAVRNALRRLVNAGIVVVAGAGNDSQDLAGTDGKYGSASGFSDDAIPAALPQALAVSAMNPDSDTLWPSSNFSQIERTNGYLVSGSPETNYVFSPGGAIDIAAPGVNILTTLWGVSGDGIGHDYAIFSGTSMAAPHVTGLVALYIAANGRATNAEGVYRIRQAIVDASLPQSQWNTTNTLDPDTNPEPLAIASEAWVPQPVIVPAGAPGNFQLSFAAVPGYDYTVQSATNLAPPVAWINLATVSGSSNVAAASVIDTNTASQSFYRLARQSLVGRLLILAQPQSRTNVVGTTANLSVTVYGEAPAYRWQKDGTPLTDGGKISGAATAELTLTGVQSFDAGNYTVVITNVHGSVTSAVAMLTIQSTVLVTGVFATATSEITSLGRYASNAVNGVYYDTSFWESVGVNSAYGNDPSPVITFDLGAVRSMKKAQIWNGHEAGPSVKRLRVETSSDGSAFSPLGEFAVTSISPASEMIALGRVTCRYVRFAILENGDGQIFPVVGPPTAGTLVAIDEVEFHEYLAD